MTLDRALGLLACPICHMELVAAENAVRCAQGHHFDVAKQGYVNLLGRSQPASADTAAMIAARERFLASGAYLPIAERVTSAVAHASGAGPVILDTGAGPGWYLSRCLDAVPAATGIATDVSTVAARRAAADDRIASVVADTWLRWPLLDATIDVMLDIFAPRNAAEAARVLRPGGFLIVVTPEPAHLATLRDQFGLLDVDPHKPGRLAAAFEDNFAEVASQVLEYQWDATAAQVSDVIAMGPNAFHHRVEPKAATLDVAVRIGQYRRS